jgi:putative ABC transport system permease protein
LVHPADLAASRLIGATSRATFALLVAGAPDQVAPFRTWLQQHKAAAERLIDVSQSSAQLGNAADRSGRFLHLSAVTTVLLAAIALAMAARRYALQRCTEVALLKCLGATRWTVLRRFAAELGVAAGLGGAIGVAIGAVTQWGLAQIAAVFTGLATLPAPGSMPAFLGLLTAAAMVAGFGLPPVMELTRVPPARVLREAAGARAFPLLYPAGAALAALLIILYLDIRDLQLIGGAALALAVVLVVYGLLAAMVVSAAARIRSDASRIWRYAAAALARRRIQSIAQLVAFSLGLTLLLLIGIVRGDLMTEWRHAVPADAPNYFLLNVDPAEREAVSGFFAAHGAPTEFAPWVRGRLQSINGIPVGNRLPPTERGRAFAEREQNLSFSAQLPRDNQLLEGQWWTSVGPTEPSVSVASEFRDELGLRLGDHLVFDIAGEPIELKVSSIRRVRWDGFRPNFFLLVSPGVLDDRVGSYLGAAHIDASARQSLGLFSRQFPTVTALDLDGVLTTVRRLIDRAAAAVTYVFAFTLFAGLVVIQAAIRSTADERKFEGALLRALGASRGRVLAGAVTEFALLGLLAGLSASVCAALIGKIIAAHWLGIPWLPGWSLWLWGPSAGCALVGSGGAVGTWIMGMTPPGSVFRGN